MHRLWNWLWVQLRQAGWCFATSVALIVSFRVGIFFVFAIAHIIDIYLHVFIKTKPIRQNF